MENTKLLIDTISDDAKIVNKIKVLLRGEDLQEYDTFKTNFLRYREEKRNLTVALDIERTNLRELKLLLEDLKGQECEDDLKAK